MISRPALERPEKNRQTSRTTSRPAPTKGWNKRDPIAAMGQLYAITMDNWIPREEFVELRKGWEQAYAGVASEQPGYFIKQTRSNGDKLLYNVIENAGSWTLRRILGPASAGELALGASGAGVWQSIDVATSGGNFTIASNGTLILLLNDGATVNQTSVSTPALTGVLPSELFCPNLFKRRVWYLDSTAMSAWYLPTNAVGGAATEFPLTALFREGGQLVAQSTWTIDGGDGVDDFLVFITTEGEVAVYGGTDPASDFRLRGLYRIPKPVGQRCLQKFNGDLWVLTEQGIVPLSKALFGALAARKSAVTDNISTAFRDSAREFPDSDVWNMTIFTEEDLLVVNVPYAADGTTVQYVMNLLTGAWCRFLGWTAIDFIVFDKALYFSMPDDITINQGMVGFSDGPDNAIVGELRTAYSYINRDVQQKHVKLVRPQFILNGNVDIMLGLGVDYDLIAPFQTALIEFLSGANSQAVWDLSLWDAALWSLGEFTALEWKTVNALPGFTFSLGVRVSSDQFYCKFTAFDLLYDSGFVL